MTAILILYFCSIGGLDCTLVPDAHITTYMPELGGINCSGDCSITASGLPVEYGVTAACGPNIPISTQIFIEGIGWRACYDRGGAIDDDEVDIAMPPDGLLLNDYRDIVFVW